MSEEKSPSGSGRLKKWPWRYPPTAAGIQVNHCKNPCCLNFGVAPLHDRKRGRPADGALEPSPGDYIATGIGKGVPGLAAQGLANLSQEDLLTLRGRLKESLALYYFFARNVFAFLGLASLSVAGFVAITVIRDGGVWESAFLSFCLSFVGTYVIFGIGALAATSCAQVHEKWMETQFEPLSQLLGGCPEALGLVQKHACCANYHAAVKRSGREIVIADLSMMRLLLSQEHRQAEQMACKELHGFAA